ncbi:BLOC-3 complex member HPS1 isoform X2 [Atheta coriaria]|uniref:BLOC-3 complex member HPS1 isoform X2 n=1 Tax=Dalotia coriaria TaxID=877792 RepID=UPI0031F475CB
MKCILVFDHLNDVIYTKYNKKFAKHVNTFAKTQKLVPTESLDSKLLTNVIVQIFSPIVTSQRIMSCQFGNSYTSIQCQDGINMTFEDYMGYLFVCIGLEEVSSMKRSLNICVTMVRFICGPNVIMLKSNPQLASLVTKLLDSWSFLQSNDQAIFVEAVEQLIVNADTSTTTLGVLQEAIEKLRCQTESNKSHALILVENKFLALYSSQNASDLGPTDIVFLTLLCQTLQKQECESDKSDSEEEFYSPSSSPIASTRSLVEAFEPEQHLDLISHQVLLTGANYEPKCVPHAVHIKRLTDDANGVGGVHLVILMETGSATLSTALYNTFSHIHILQTVQIQRQVDTLRPAFENLDVSVKKLCDNLKKSKNNAIESCYKQLGKIWELMKKKYVEFIKGRSMEALLRAESCTPTLLDCLKEILSLTSFDHTVLKSSQIYVNEIAESVKEKLANYSEFFKVKAMRNFSLGSYLEEFPGLVHFVYIDRSSHRVTTPSLDFNSEQTNTLTKSKIWSMINFSRAHLQEGHLSLMWKDTTFNYAYFLWFEDTSGAPLKPTVFPTHASKVLPQPGIICGDFYQKLKELCFPKMSPHKIRCYELFCIHLGLATSTCVLEHTRRLAATIWELRGHPNHPMDLL